MALTMEELDRLMQEPQMTGLTGYTSQLRSIAQGMAIVSVADRDDVLFLPRDLSLAALHRGVTVEQFVGQWLGNLLDPGKGRLFPGNLASEAVQIVPRVGAGREWLAHALGLACAMKVKQHAKLVVLPLFRKDLANSELLQCMRSAVRAKAPLLFLVLDGDGSAFAKAAGMRSAVQEESDFLATLKFLKGQFDRTRSKGRPVMVSFAAWESSAERLSDLLQAFLDSRGWQQPPELVEQVKAEVKYGIERAVTIPAPPKQTVIQDVRKLVSPELEAAWKDWKAVHGK